MTFHALIMAGGIGSRLWPRSRIEHPKQFLDLTGDLTMLQQAQHRIRPIILPEHTFVATNQRYVDIVGRQLPELPRPNILGEPVGRGTAAAVGFAAIHIRQHNPDAVMAVLTGDHLIKKVDVFQQVLDAAAQSANKGWLVTLGIKPGYPETGYGYIERGEHLTAINGHEVVEVARFVEKPNYARAEVYLKSGNYAWNSGMFIWRVDRILEEMAAQMPALYAGLVKIEQSLGTPQADETLARVFPQLPNQTIDYGIMENAEKVAMLPVDIGWNDVGSWSAVYDVLPRDPRNNAVVGSHISPDTKNSLVYSPKRLVATIGLDDVVIVDTDDVLLVCPRSRSQEVKKIVDMLKNNGDSDYLRGVTSPKTLTGEQVRRLLDSVDAREKMLLSLLLHSGLQPGMIVGAKADDFDLIHGWAVTPESKRPLADATREAIFAWMRAQNTLAFSLDEYWASSAAIKNSLSAIGERAGMVITIENLYETLARALFDASEEAAAIRSAFGEEANLVRVPLQALFPFSQDDFTGQEDSSVGARARAALNKSAKNMVDG